MLDRCLPTAAPGHLARATVAACAVLGALSAAARDATPSVPSYDKARPGRYGRIDVRGATPPVIYAKPVVARQTVDGAGRPVYLYVPPGQVRKWTQHCAKWQACDRPVYFVRVDDSPSRLGGWKKTLRPQPPESAVLQALNRFAS